MRADFAPRLAVVAVCAATLMAAPLPLGAQIAIAIHDVNLRPSHSTDDPPLRAITDGDTLTLVASDTTNGYLHVRTRGDSAEGWVYGRYVTIIAAPAAHAIEPSARAAPPPAPPIAPPVAPAASPPAAPAGSILVAPASYHSCPNEGVNRSGNIPAPPIQALNLLKNRYSAPTSSEIDHAITLAALIAPGDDRGRFDERKGAVIEGVVTDIRVGGEETTNCEATAPKYRDTHIRIALTGDAPEIQRVVVEVTPRWREAMAAAGVDWSTEGLTGTLVGRRVRVGGWMLFDTEHVKQSENSNPGNPKNWRATAWEVHPITRIEILP